MRTVEDVERELDALRRRGRIVGYVGLAVALALIIAAVVILTASPAAHHDPDSVSVISA